MGSHCEGVRNPILDSHPTVSEECVLQFNSACICLPPTLARLQGAGKQGSSYMLSFYESLSRLSTGMYTSYPSTKIEGYSWWVMSFHHFDFPGTWHIRHVIFADHRWLPLIGNGRFLALGWLTAVMERCVCTAWLSGMGSPFRRQPLRHDQNRWEHYASLPSVMALLCPLLFPSPQVDEIYHDESLGTNINVVLVRIIMVGYRQVRIHRSITHTAH